MTDKPQKQAQDDPLIYAWCSKCFAPFNPKHEGNGLYVRCSRCNSDTKNFSYNSDDLKKFIKIPVMCPRCDYFWMRTKKANLKPRIYMKRKNRMLNVCCPSCKKWISEERLVSYFRERYAQDEIEINQIIIKKYPRGWRNIVLYCKKRHIAFENWMAWMGDATPEQ